MALRRSAAILEALRSAAAEDEEEVEEVEEEEEEEEGSGRMGPAWEGFSTGGAGWRRRAAAVEALVKGPILEKSLEEDQKVIFNFGDSNPPLEFVLNLLLQDLLHAHLLNIKDNMESTWLLMLYNGGANCG